MKSAFIFLCLICALSLYFAQCSERQNLFVAAKSCSKRQKLFIYKLPSTIGTGLLETKAFPSDLPSAKCILSRKEEIKYEISGPLAEQSCVVHKS